MTGDRIIEELVRLTDSYQPNPPPIDTLIIDGSRKRRRRATLAITGVAAAAVVIIGTGAALTNQTGSPHPDPSTQGPTDPTPQNTRLVGVGHAAIDVPRSWSTNHTACGTPTDDTVIINVTIVPSCAIFPRPRVSSVDVVFRDRRPGYPDFTHAETVNIDGVDAFRTPLDCTNVTSRRVRHGSDPAPERVCTQATWIPEESALFIATTPQPETTQELIDTVHIDPSYAAVPKSNLIATPKEAVATFTRNAQALGLRVVVKTQDQPRFDPGSILGVSPATGTVLPVGSTIHLTLAEPATPTHRSRGPKATPATPG